MRIALCRDQRGVILREARIRCSPPVNFRGERIRWPANRDGYRRPGTRRGTRLVMKVIWQIGEGIRSAEWVPGISLVHPPGGGEATDGHRVVLRAHLEAVHRSALVGVRRLRDPEIRKGPQPQAACGNGIVPPPGRKALGHTSRTPCCPDRSVGHVQFGRERILNCCWGWGPGSARIVPGTLFAVNENSVRETRQHPGDLQAVGIA